MYSMKFVYLGLLTGTLCTVNASEGERGRSGYENRNLKPTCILDTCRFGTHGTITIENLDKPLTEKWYSHDKLDSVDQYIFVDHRKIPYRNDDITIPSPETAYVIQAIYEPLRDKAQKALDKKLTELETIQRNTNQNNLAEVVSAAIVRLKKQKQLLELMETFEHMCIGAIVTQQAIKCVLLWSSLEPSKV